ncbi:MAG: glutamate synthase subunit alpha, partial [Aquificota bacterium]
VILGNTVLYGATGGMLFAAGVAGERFAVRNSGAIAVVEGVGEHGCEYMTNGKVMILGETGKNFGAAMTGGIAYVYDPEGKMKDRINTGYVFIDKLDEDDTEDIKELLIKHKAYTGSPRASNILDNFDEEIENFVKISPISVKKPKPETDEANVEEK